jgi:hypothetical protein
MKSYPVNHSQKWFQYGLLSLLATGKLSYLPMRRGGTRASTREVSRRQERDFVNFI